MRYCYSIEWPGALDFDGVAPADAASIAARAVALYAPYEASWIVLRLSSVRADERVGVHVLPVWGHGRRSASSCEMRHKWGAAAPEPDALHACGDRQCQGGSEWRAHVRVDPRGVIAYPIDVPGGPDEGDQDYVLRAAVIAARESPVRSERVAARGLLEQWGGRPIPGAVYAQREHGEGGRS